MRFYVGMHQPSDAARVDRACISINRLRNRKSGFSPPRLGWMLDSGAFTEVAIHGGYRHSPQQYAADAGRWPCDVAASQDFMCEPFVTQRTGLTVADHQRLTIERYDAIRRAWTSDTPLMPVLQGWTFRDYTNHLDAYGDRLSPGMWVGVGSVCKRQSSVAVVEDLLSAIAEVRPDLRLHGFRCEADGAAKPARAPAAVLRRQHGLELLRPKAGARRQRLARGRGLRSQGRPAAARPRTAPALVRTTR